MSGTTASKLPLLIGSAVASPNDDARSVCRASTGSVEAKAAHTLNFARAGERPLLVCATVAGPEADGIPGKIPTIDVQTKTVIIGFYLSRLRYIVEALVTAAMAVIAQT